MSKFNEKNEMKDTTFLIKVVSIIAIVLIVSGYFAFICEYNINKQNQNSTKTEQPRSNKVKDSSGKEWDGVIKDQKFFYNYTEYPDTIINKKYIVKDGTIVPYIDYVYANIEDNAGNVVNIITSEEYDATDVFLGDVFYDLFDNQDSTDKKKICLTSVQNIRLEQDKNITFKTVEDYKDEQKNNSPKEGEVGLKDYKFEVIEKSESGIFDQYITSNGEMTKEDLYCIVLEDYNGIVQSIYNENLYNTLEVGDEVLCDIIINYEKDSNIIDTNKMILKNIRKIKEDK